MPDDLLGPDLRYYIDPFTGQSVERRLPSGVYSDQADYVRRLRKAVELQRSPASYEYVNEPDARFERMNMIPEMVRPAEMPAFTRVNGMGPVTNNGAVPMQKWYRDSLPPPTLRDRAIRAMKMVSRAPNVPAEWPPSPGATQPLPDPSTQALPAAGSRVGNFLRGVGLPTLASMLGGYAGQKGAEALYNPILAYYGRPSVDQLEAQRAQEKQQNFQALYALMNSMGSRNSWADK